MNKFRRIWHILIFIAVFAAAVAVIMLLWNTLIPSIIGWSSINYWQAGGLAILSRLLFGGLGRHGHGFPFGRHHGKHAELHKTMKNMSHDERREFIRKRISRDFAEFHDRDSTQHKHEDE